MKLLFLQMYPMVVNLMEVVILYSFQYQHQMNLILQMGLINFVMHLNFHMMVDYMKILYK